MTIDRNRCRELRNKLETILKNHPDLDGLEVDIGNMSFDSAEVSVKINFKVSGAETQDDKTLKAMAKIHRLDLNSSGPEGEKLIGYNTRARKTPWIFITPNGRKYKTTTATAAFMFGAS